MIVAAGAGQFRLTWTGKKWVDESGGEWRPVRDYKADFISERHGRAIIITEQNEKIAFFTEKLKNMERRR